MTLRGASARESVCRRAPRTLNAGTLTPSNHTRHAVTEVLGAFVDSERPEPSPAALSAAEAWLGQSVPVVIPTETVYGLAARALDRDAVLSIFEIKGRPADNPLIVHVTRPSHLEQAGAVLSPLARRLIERFWPGPLTLVVPCSAALPWVTAGLDSVAVRHPSHPFAAALIDRVGPLAAPSANLSGRPSPTRARHALADLRGRVPLIVDGGELEHGLESTVLDVRGDAPVLLRPGALPAELLEQALERRIEQASAHAAVRSPGMKYRHYSPRAELWLYPRDERPGAPPEGPVAALLGSDARALRASGRTVAAIAREPIEVDRFIPHPNDPGELARRLFGWLHDLDELGVDCILIEGVAHAGVGRAVMDRLERAATRVRGASAAAQPARGGAS
jgi:L-threonylcarbamoyladenylate synthase